MRVVIMVLLTASLLLPLAPSVTAQEESGPGFKTYLWFGGHYTSFSDYTRKVGEYNLGNTGLLPEFRTMLSGNYRDGYYRFAAHYYDDQNIFGKYTAKIGDRFSGSIRFRSLTHQQGQDLLADMEAREMTGSGPGGKMLTHELLDPGASYHTNRNELQTELNVRLSQKGNIRMIAAHRSIVEKGTEQKVSSTHCFSCHLTSQTADIDKRTHMFEIGIEAQPGDFELGYKFGYRNFKSVADQATVFYDQARHPVNGGSAEEFGSRLIYDNEVINYGIYPESEKLSHKAKVKGKVGKGRVAAALGFARIENDVSALSADALSGSLNYSIPFSNKTRLIARVSAVRMKADDPLIDLPLWRDGRPGTPVDFEFTRYSSLDRLDARGSAEVITRINPKLTLSLLAGLKSIKRDDYPEKDTDYSTSTFTSQIKARYRQGMKFSGNFKYRFEKTSDPFTSARGLFESRGREELTINTPPGFAFYYQREDLRYQDITTLPTDYHGFEAGASIRPSLKSTINLGLKAEFDKNGNLDSLDVKHSLLRPSVALSLTPDPRWVFTGGYVYSQYKSRGPVTVAMFDG